jgi:hypothetical protein
LSISKYQFSPDNVTSCHKRLEWINHEILDQLRPAVTDHAVAVDMARSAGVVAGLAGLPAVDEAHARIAADGVEFLAVERAAEEDLSAAYA